MSNHPHRDKLPERLVVTFTPAPGNWPAPFWIRCRRMLKAAGRAYGLRALWPTPAELKTEPAHANAGAFSDGSPCQNVQNVVKRASGQVNATGGEVEVF